MDNDQAPGWGGRDKRTAVIGVTAIALFVVAVIASWGLMSLNFGPGVAPKEGAGVSGAVRVVATIPPLAWPVRELTPHAEVTVIMAPGTSPHALELTPSHAQALAEADVVLGVGLGLDDAILRALEARPKEGREIVLLEDCLEAAGVVVGEHDHAHDHDHDHDHDHGPVDPHAWLDPAVMSVFVGRVDSALGRATGGASSGRTILQERCDHIDAAYRLSLVSNVSDTIVCQHNAYGYLASRYGLTVAAVLNPVGSGEVSPGDVKAVMDAVRRYNVGAIFIEPQTSASVAERIASETGIRVLTLDPVGSTDWPALMEANLEVLREGLALRGPRLPE